MCRHLFCGTRSGEWAGSERPRINWLVATTQASSAQYETRVSSLCHSPKATPTQIVSTSSQYTTDAMRHIITYFLRHVRASVSLPDKIWAIRKSDIETCTHANHNTHYLHLPPRSYQLIPLESPTCRHLIKMQPPYRQTFTSNYTNEQNRNTFRLQID